MKKIKLFLSLVLVTILFGCSSSSGSSNSGAPIKTTFMVYIVGSNLESNFYAGNVNIREMVEGTKGDTDTNIIIQTGAGQHSNTPATDPIYNQPLLVKDWTKLQLHKIHNGQLTTIEENMGASCHEYETVPNCTPMSKGNITEFIKKAVAQAPADRYVLVLWDHGSGSIHGYGDPENLSSVIDIQEAVKNSGVHFDIIGYDACLMATLDSAYSLKDYADYYVASEETEDGFGWDYKKIMETLAANKSISSRDLAVRITEVYQERYIDDPTYTLSAIDLSKIEAVKTAYENYTNAMNSNISAQGTDLNAWVDFNDARKKVDHYAEYADSNILHVDLKDLVSLSSNGNNDFGLIEAINNAVISNKSARTTSYGISIFMPYYYDLMSLDSSSKPKDIVNYEQLYGSIMPNNTSFIKSLYDISKGGANEGAITISNQNSQDLGTSTKYTGNVNSSYGFREINVLSYYNDQSNMMLGTPIMEQTNLTGSDATNFNYDFTVTKGMLQLANHDGTVNVRPYAVEDNMTGTNEHKLSIISYYATQESVQCMEENSSMELDLMLFKCRILPFVMDITVNNNGNVVAVDPDLKVYDKRATRIAAVLQPGDTVFLNSAIVTSGSIQQGMEVSFDKNNKFVIQQDLVSSFKGSIVDTVDANAVKFMILAINHAGGRKVVDYPGGINAKTNADYMSEADIIAKAYKSRP